MQVVAQTLDGALILHFVVDRLPGKTLRYWSLHRNGIVIANYDTEKAARQAFRRARTVLTAA